MAGRRVDADRLRELIRLHRLGTSARETARLLHMGSTTERRYRRALAKSGLLGGSLDGLPSLDELRRGVLAELPVGGQRCPDAPWHGRVDELLAKGLSARAIFDRLRLEAAELVSYSSVKRHCRARRRAPGALADAVVIPLATSPGESAQVDFGYAGKLYDPATGVLRRAWVFVMILTHSRLMSVRLVFDQKVETWLRLHGQAFAEFGGCPATVIPDNTRRAVLRAAFGLHAPTELNRSYRELAQHYGFKIDPAPPGSPWVRGKVEAAVKYLRGNPLKGRDGESIDTVQATLRRWNDEIASVRVHGTTGRRPRDLFEAEERAALRPLPATVHDAAVWKRARVHPDSHVAFRDRLFSVPWALIHEEVWIRATTARLEVFHDDRRVAEHERTSRWRTTVEAHLPEDRRELRHRGRSLWEERAASVGPETLGLVRAVFDSDEVLSRLRQVQAIVTHLERYPRLRAEAAARRALQTGDHSYRSVKAALLLGLDLLPPNALPVTTELA